MSATLLFNPSRLDTDELEAMFVGRGALLERFVGDLSRDAATHTSRHWLLVGLRGMGKSHLVELVARRLRRDHGWSVVRMPEEHYQVSCLADLLEQIVVRLTDAPSPYRDEGDPSRVELLAIDMLRKRSGPLLVAVENLGDLLDKLSLRDQHRLREILMLDAPFTLFATAPGRVEATTDHDAPFYDFFQTLTLDELRRDEVRELITARMKRDSETALIDRDEDLLGRFDALYHFSGGNPRLVLALYGVLREGATETFHAQMLELLDRITPYYQARLADIAPQMARVLTEMALAEGPLTPAEIARRTRLKTNQVTANMAKLADERLVRATGRPDLRRRYYEVVDRLFRIWLQMREDTSGRTRFRFLADFYEAVYTGRRDLAWRLAEKLRERFWRSTSAGDALLAHDAARTLDHLGPALGLGDDVVQVVLDSEPEPAKESELLALDEQFTRAKSIEARQAIALRLVEGWDEQGRAERAFDALSAVDGRGPVPWRLGVWSMALAQELGRDLSRETVPKIDKDHPAKEIIEAMTSGDERAVSLFEERSSRLDTREQRALLRLLSVLFPGAVHEAIFSSHRVIHRLAKERFPEGLPLDAYPSIFLISLPPSMQGWRVLRPLLRRGFRGVSAASALLEMLAKAPVELRDEMLSWLKGEIPDRQMLCWMLVRMRSPWVLTPYAHLRASGYLEPISPLEAALQVRDAADKNAVLMTLHPEEREAVMILLEGLSAEKDNASPSEARTSP